MNGSMDEETMAPQNFLYGCKLEAGKDITFNPEDDDFEHQLDLRMACVDATTKDVLHVVEVEGQDEEGQKVTAVLASLKPSTLPSVCLGGFTITPPAVFRLKAGTGPIHISGQHLVIMEGEQSFDEGEEEEDEEEVEEVVEVPTSKKRPAASPAGKNQKKQKKEVEEEEEDEEEDDEDDEDEDDEDDVEDSPVPVKAKPAPKAKTPAQNGKGAKSSTPVKGSPQTPTKTPNKKTPIKKTPLGLEEAKLQILASIKKGRTLPKLQPKFENLVKNAYKVSDAKVLEDLWKWKQTLE
ncbi:unnamed protein product [Boreogadus saida]